MSATRIATWERLWGAYVDALDGARTGHGRKHRVANMRLGKASAALVRWCRDNGESIPSCVGVPS